MSDKPVGRPRKSDEDKEVTLKFAVQPELYAYLGRLAGTRFIASSPDQVARHILIEALEERRRSGYLGVEFDPSKIE